MLLFVTLFHRQPREPCWHKNKWEVPALLPKGFISAALLRYVVFAKRITSYSEINLACRDTTITTHDCALTTGAGSHAKRSSTKYYNTDSYSRLPRWFLQSWLTVLFLRLLAFAHPSAHSEYVFSLRRLIVWCFFQHRKGYYRFIVFFFK